MKLIIAGGGTGGHLFPGMAVAEEFLQRSPDNRLMFVGTEKGIEGRILPGSGYAYRFIPAAGLRGKGLFSQLKGVALFLHGYAESRKVLREFAPDCVLGVGGYASAPLVLAARGLQIPAFIHEQNAIPGLTNRLLAKVAARVFISLPGSESFFPKESTLLTGNPLRRAIRERNADQAVSQDGRFRLLVFGGSSGAHMLNKIMIDTVCKLQPLSNRLLIMHQTGEKDLKLVKDGYAAASMPADVLPFIDDMAASYRWADLIVCRAGATTIAETTACGKPCIYIPYPHAVDDHQRRNAEALLTAGACRMLLERELSGERLAAEILGLANDPDALREMGRIAQSMARLDAAEVIVDELCGHLSHPEAGAHTT